MNIDFKVDLFYEILPILHGVISECKNHSYFHLEYNGTSFEIFIIPDIGWWTALMMGYAENGQSLNEIDPDFGTIDKYGIRLNKPYSIRLYVHNFYRNAVVTHPIVPPRVPFMEESCVVCTVNGSNILYTNCGHMCICDFCDRTYPINTCPLCRRECVNKFYLRHY